MTEFYGAAAGDVITVLLLVAGALAVWRRGLG